MYQPDNGWKKKQCETRKLYLWLKSWIMSILQFIIWTMGVDVVLFKQRVIFKQYGSKKHAFSSIMIYRFLTKLAKLRVYTWQKTDNMQISQWQLHTGQWQVLLWRNMGSKWMGMMSSFHQPVVMCTCKTQTIKKFCPSLFTNCWTLVQGNLLFNSSHPHASKMNSLKGQYNDNCSTTK
jgi:hypothetical protein